MLHLKITSLEWLVWDEEVKQITVDTLAGQITVLPWHDNLISVLKPGLVKLVPAESTKERSFQFLTGKEYIVFGVMGGVLKVEWDQLQLLTNMVITDNQNPLDILEKSKQLLKEQLTKLQTWAIERDPIEADLEKIDLELKLAYRKQAK